jgi:hypothetical protein
MDMKKAMAAHYKEELLTNKIRGSGRTLTPEERAMRFTALRARAEFLKGHWKKEALDELARIEQAAVQPEQEQPVEQGRKRRVKESGAPEAKKSNKKDVEAGIEAKKSNKKDAESGIEGVGLGGFRDRQCALHRTSCEARGPGLGGVGMEQRSGRNASGRCSVSDVPQVLAASLAHSALRCTLPIPRRVVEFVWRCSRPRWRCAAVRGQELQGAPVCAQVLVWAHVLPEPQAPGR